jgi:hypothetical protein
MDHSQIVDGSWSDSTVPSSPRSMRARRSVEDVDRKRVYFVLMGSCIVLILLAWNVVRFWSTTAAVVMSVVAAVLPPVAVVVANWGHEG